MQKSSNPLLFPIVLAGLVMAAPFANAASQCKNLSQDACSAEPACAWVNGYTRKDGREVKAYCRNAPTRKGSQQSAAPSPKADKPG